jgi:hypothetical protein
VLVDVRNVYESRIGYFSVPGIETIRPPLRQFSDFPRRGSCVRDEGSRHGEGRCQRWGQPIHAGWRVWCAPPPNPRVWCGHARGIRGMGTRAPSRRTHGTAPWDTHGAHMGRPCARSANGVWGMGTRAVLWGGVFGLCACSAECGLLGAGMCGVATHRVLRASCPAGRAGLLLLVPWLLCVVCGGHHTTVWQALLLVVAAAAAGNRFT